MRLDKTAKRRFLKARHSSGKSVVLSRFVTSVAHHFLQSTVALFFFLSVVSKCAWAKKRKTVYEACHSSGKSGVFSFFEDIGRTICTIDVRIILKARNNSGKSVVFLCFETLNPQSENFFEVVGKMIGTFSSYR